MIIAIQAGNMQVVFFNKVQGMCLITILSVKNWEASMQRLYMYTDFNRQVINSCFFKPKKPQKTADRKQLVQITTQKQLLSKFLICQRETRPELCNLAAIAPAIYRQQESKSNRTCSDDELILNVTNFSFEYLSLSISLEAPASGNNMRILLTFEQKIYRKTTSRRNRDTTSILQDRQEFVMVQ